MQDAPSKRCIPKGNAFGKLRLNLRRLLKQETGAAVVVAAILFPVVIGGMGLGVETGYWYLTQRKLQHAADVSVHAAAGRKRAGDDIPAMQTAARQVATTTGHSPAKGILIVNTPPTSGKNAGMENSVEVEIAESHPRLFSSIFSSEPVKITARAVAQLEGGAKACVLALGKTLSGAVTVSGSTSVNLTNCDVASNSNASDSFRMSGSSSQISTDCIQTVGTAVTTVGLTLKVCPAVREHATASADPYAGVPEPANVGTCHDPKFHPNLPNSLSPTENHPSGVKVMKFCNGLDTKGTVTFGPGLYIIEGGDFTVNGGSVDSNSPSAIVGSGVTFYLVGNARLRLSGASIDFSAPESGPFSGLLFFGSRASTAGMHAITGNTSVALQGAVYAPANHVSVSGNSSSSDGCTQIIAHQVTFTGSSQMASECQSVGGRDILVGQSVAIVE